MNYAFPIIETIDDVLPHIQGYDEIVVSENVQGNFVTIRYMVSTPRLWERTLGWEVRRECRGIAFCTKSGKILSRPYHKFFNVDEKPETQLNKINLYEPHVVLEKLDGSMIRPIKCPDGDFYIATKAGQSEVSALASKWLRDHLNYYDFMSYVIDNYDLTPIFEFCSRKNRIVIDYPEDRVVLTALRANRSGIYYQYDQLVEFARRFDIDYVKTINTLPKQNIKLFVNEVKEWKGSEGIVLRFDTGHMLKTKADDYVISHSAKESINQEKNVIALILSDSIDDLLPIISEYDKYKIVKFEEDFHISVARTANYIHDLYSTWCPGADISTRRDFATGFVAHQPQKYHQFLYKLYGGSFSILQDLYDYIGKNLSSSSQVDKVRWAFGDLQWK